MSISNVKPMPSQSRVKQLFDYDPATGVLTRKTPKITSSATIVKTSAIVDGVRFEKHRLIWVWAKGFIPHGHIVDHKNRDRTDFRLANLRCVTWDVNVRNTNRRGARGLPKLVSMSRNGKYAVNIRIGTYDTLAEATVVAQKTYALIHP